jgi:hypothetical protein
MTGQGVKTSCKDLFKEIEILPLNKITIIKIKKLFISNYDSHNVKTYTVQKSALFLHYINPVSKRCMFYGHKNF